MLPQSCAVLFGLLAVIFTFSGFLLPGLIRREVHDGMLRSLIPSPQQPAEMYQEFIDDGATRADLANPMYRTYYFFNITNPEEVRKGAKPILREVGPFRYWMRNRRLNVSFTYDGRVQWRPFTQIIPLDPQPGDPPLTSRITTLNLPIIGAAASLEASLGEGVRLGAVLRALSEFLSFDPDAQGLLVTKTAQEFLWGYDDATLTRLRAVSPIAFPTRVALELVPRTEAQALCWRGWEEKRTGASNPRTDFSQMTKWNDMTDMDALWGVQKQRPEDPPVFPVRGSDGFGFGFGDVVDANCTAATPELEIFLPEAYRVAKLRCGPPSSFKGIDVVPYYFSPSTFAQDERVHQLNSGLWNLTYPYSHAVLGQAQACGILDKDDTGDRASNAAAVATAAPYVLLSPPHFCYGRAMPSDATDPSTSAASSPLEPPVINPASLRAGVLGLQDCEASNGAFDTRMDIEPFSGLPLRAHVHLQLSTVLTNHWAAIEPDVTPAIVPLFRVHVHKEVDDTQASLFRDKALKALRLSELIGQWGPILGAVLFGIAVFVAAVFVDEDTSSARIPKGYALRLRTGGPNGVDLEQPLLRGQLTPQLFAQSPSFGSRIYLGLSETAPLPALVVQDAYDTSDLEAGNGNNPETDQRVQRWVAALPSTLPSPQDGDGLLGAPSPSPSSGMRSPPSGGRTPDIGPSPSGPYASKPPIARRPSPRLLASQEAGAPEAGLTMPPPVGHVHVASASPRATPSRLSPRSDRERTDSLSPMGAGDRGGVKRSPSGILKKAGGGYGSETEGGMRSPRSGNRVRFSDEGSLSPGSQKRG